MGILNIFRNSLAIRLVIASLVISSVLSVFSTGVQLFATYQRETNVAIAGLDKVELALAESLEQALWTFDFEQVEIILAGLRSNASVAQLTLTTPTGQSWQLGEGEGSSIVRRYVLTKRQDTGEADVVGELFIEVGRAEILNAVVAQFWTVFASNLTKAYFAALALLAVFAWMVTQHLRKIADYVDHTSVEARDGPLQLDRRPRRVPDDLDSIANAINSYKARVSEAMARLRQQIAERSAAEQKAKSAAEARNSFLSTMSHEVRTPLNAILGLLHLIEIQEESSEKHKQYARVGKRAGHQLLNQLNNVLDMARLDASGVEIRRSAVDMRKLARQWQETASALVAILDKSVEVTLTLHDDLKDHYELDQARVTQIVTNLTDNAVKFTSSGEVNIDVAPRGDGLRISVADTGPGIAPEERERVFSRFTQLENGIDRPKGGSGLGLAICLELAKLMGGTITVEDDHSGRYAVMFVLSV
ncbi:ATP-binding protein [Primorskyibacter sp. S187A]|uniref:sensor histidine kinase n=1 Tax=Primorskyibacter sp. S187A TaxID=3415130 RepID=UPI003C7D9B63